LIAPIRLLSRNIARGAVGEKTGEKTPGQKAVRVEDEYTRKTPIEHVLLRPGMYIGSTEETSADAWVYDIASGRMVRQTISFVPGLLKVFDEILVNACDNAQRDPTGMTRLDVWIDSKKGSKGMPVCRVRNDGRGIPIVQHATEKLFVHELVFGHLLTGSNFGSSADRAATTGGQHGYGAKLTNIFSSKFVVRAADAARGLSYEQSWSHNMSEISKAAVSPLAAGVRDFTEIEFSPDVSRFARGVHVGIDAGSLAAMHRRVIDAAGTLSLASSAARVAVSFNDDRVLVKDWADYVNLYTPPNRAETPAPAKRKVSTAARELKGLPKGTVEPSADGAQPAWPLPVIIAGITPHGAGSILSGLQVATLSDRLQVGAGAAGLKISQGGWAPPSASTSPSIDASALEAYNSPGAFASFVNGMATSRGGSHVTLVLDALSRRLADHCTKRLKKVASSSSALSASMETDSSSTNVMSSSAALSSALASAVVTPSLVRSHLRVAVNVRLSSPAFDSQSKDALVTPIDAVISDLVSAPASATPSSRAEVAESLFSDSFVSAVAEEGGVLFAVVSTLASKAAAELTRSARRPSRVGDAKIRGIPKLEDANWAGTKRASECTLILTEGDSAKALAVAGLSEVGRDAYGVFPLRGKLLNVRDVQIRDALENAEISALMVILGLDLARAYEDGPKSLRYGRVMIMADQDVDGSHIKGLVINMFHTFWPKLIEASASGSFLQQFITPVIKAKRAGVTREFFSIRDFNTWRTTADEGKKSGWVTKYYKGLGTSTSQEGRSYFKAIAAHTRSFCWGGADDGEAIRLAFSRDRADDRKDWLAHAAADANNADRAARAHATQLSYAHFVHDELVDFSLADIARSIPSIVDGLKPSQRKVLYATLKRSFGRSHAGAEAVNAAIRGSRSNDDSVVTSSTSEIKVAQLAGYVAEHTAYHHGEASLVSTIVSMAQDFVGSNNVPLLSPLGQFGTRLAGGKDAASARYIFTRVSNLARAFFPPSDDDLLRSAEDDGATVEPVAFLPVVPFVLLNGVAGIGTGWSTLIPPHHPLHVVRAVREALDNGWSHGGDRSDIFTLLPWWRGFTGEVEPIHGQGSATLEGVNTVGCVNWDDGEHERADKRRGSEKGAGDYIDGLLLSDTSNSTPPGGATSVRITELPIGRWTETYKAFLHGLVADGAARTVKEFHTESRAEFLVTLTPAGISGVLAAAAAARGGPKSGRAVALSEANWHAGLVSFFRLSTPQSMRNMHLFDVEGRVMRFSSAWDIIRHWMPLRAEGYAIRRLAIAAALSRAERRATAQAAFLTEVRAGRIELGRANKADLEATLSSLGYPLDKPEESFDPPSSIDLVSTVGARYFDTERVAKWAREVAATPSTSPATPTRGAYDYLLEIPISRLTDESAEKSRSTATALSAALVRAKSTTAEDMWRADLTHLERALQEEGFRPSSTV
jgi:DNA topoisomerase-2